MAEAAATIETIPIIGLALNRQTWGLVFEANIIAVVVVVIVLGIAAWIYHGWARGKVELFDVGETELGVGSSRITFKPNYTDRQVAYQVWVELSTRKIGLPIDLDHDVIAEVYDSWHAFFGVTRELIKSIPVNKVASDSTKKIVDLSIDVLNKGLRPHLTRWQARFRAWYDRQIAADTDKEPQEIQRSFGSFEELKGDMLVVNGQLIAYREAMYLLVYGSKARAVAAVARAEEVVHQPSDRA